MNYEDRITKSYLEDALAAKCEIVFGTYVGDGALSQQIDLGFRPKAVYVCRCDGSTRLRSDTGEIAHYGGLAVNGGAAYTEYNYSTIIAINDTGFSVFYSTTTSAAVVRANENGHKYFYIVFK